MIKDVWIGTFFQISFSTNHVCFSFFQTNPVVITAQATVAADPTVILGKIAAGVAAAVAANDSSFLSLFLENEGLGALFMNDVRFTNKFRKKKGVQ